MTRIVLPPAMFTPVPPGSPFVPFAFLSRPFVFRNLCPFRAPSCSRISAASPPSPHPLEHSLPHGIKDPKGFLRLPRSHLAQPLARSAACSARKSFRVWFPQLAFLKNWLIPRYGLVKLEHPCYNINGLAPTRRSISLATTHLP